MGGSVHQKTKVGYNSSTRVTNTYPRKRGKITNLPRNSVVVFEKDFDKSSLKQKIARLKSSPSYKIGESKARAQLKNAKTIRLRKGQALNIKNRNLRVKVSTS